MMSKNINHHLAVFDTAARRNLVAKYEFLSVVVHSRAEYELSALPRPIESPTSEATRNLLYILLGISPFYAKGVKLHNLTSIVFVNTRLPALSSGRNLRLCALLLSIHLLALHFAIYLLIAIVRVVQPRISKSSETRSLLQCPPSHLVSIW
jgi:hypothetical protein